MMPQDDAPHEPPHAGGRGQRHGRPSLLRAPGGVRRRAPLAPRRARRGAASRVRPRAPERGVRRTHAGRSPARRPDIWYAEHGLAVHLGERVVVVDRAAHEVVTALGRRVPYDALVLATGSAPFVPPLPGVDLPGVFVYRTIDDLDAIRAWARRRAARGGDRRRPARARGGEGGARPRARDPRRRVRAAPDAAPGRRRAAARSCATPIEQLGVQRARRRAHRGDRRRRRRRARRCVSPAAVELAVDMVIVSAGIRPRDELARAAGLALGERGGIVVDAGLAHERPATSTAIGECALATGMVYGLVAPGYEMARVAGGAPLRRATRSFTGADLSTKLKLLGVDVASFGDAFADEALGTRARRVVFEDRVRGVYQKLVCQRRVGGCSAASWSATPSAYPTLLLARARAAASCPSARTSCSFGAARRGAAPSGLDDDAQVCSCNNVTPGAIRSAIARAGADARSSDVKACTRAGTGCGGCVPLRDADPRGRARRAGPRRSSRDLCEHFAYTRQELFEIVKLGRIESFDALLASHGTRRRLRGLPARGRVDPRQHLERLRPRRTRRSRTPTTASSPTSSAAAPTR